MCIHFREQILVANETNYATTDADSTRVADY